MSLVRYAACAAASLVIVTFAFASSLSIASAQVPSPGPSATPATCATPGAVSTADAFAHPIDDARTLAFIEVLANVKGDARNAIVKRASTTAKVPDGTCPDVELAYRMARAQAIVKHRWDVRGSATLARPLLLALASLQSSDGTGDRDALLAIFGTSVAKLDARIATQEVPPKPSPRAKPYDPCNTDARVTAPVEPLYPPSAQRAGVGGTFLAAVAVDVHGFVRTVTVQSTISPATGDALNDLTNEALLVAAESHYAPGFTQCTPVPGTYVYRNDFVSR